MVRSARSPYIYIVAKICTGWNLTISVFVDFRHECRTMGIQVLIHEDEGRAGFDVTWPSPVEADVTEGRSELS